MYSIHGVVWGGGEGPPPPKKSGFRLIDWFSKRHQKGYSQNNDTPTCELTQKSDTCLSDQTQNEQFGPQSL